MFTHRYCIPTCLESRQCMMKTSAPCRLLVMVKIYCTSIGGSSWNKKTPDTHIRPRIHIWAIAVTVKALRGEQEDGAESKSIKEKPRLIKITHEWLCCISIWKAPWRVKDNNGRRGLSKAATEEIFFHWFPVHWKHVEEEKPRANDRYKRERFQEVLYFKNISLIYSARILCSVHLSRQAVAVKEISDFSWVTNLAKNRFIKQDLIFEKDRHFFHPQKALINKLMLSDFFLNIKKKKKNITLTSVSGRRCSLS